MSKFCQRCGKPMADDMRFCEACGAPAPVAAPQQPVYQQAPQQPVYRQAPQQPAYRPAAPAAAPAAAKPANNSFDVNKVVTGVVNRFKSDKTFMLICCGIAAVVVLAIILACVFLIKSPQVSAVEKMISISYSGKGSSSRIKSMAPAEYWEYVEDNDGYDTEFKDLVDEYEDWWEDQIDEMEEDLGDNIKVKFEHKNTVDMSKSDVNDIAEELDETYGIDEDDVTAGKRIQGILIAEGDDKEEGWKAMVLDICVVKIKGRWYCVTEGGDFYIDSLVSSLAYRAN